MVLSTVDILLPHEVTFTTSIPLQDFSWLICSFRLNFHVVVVVVVVFVGFCLSDPILLTNTMWQITECGGHVSPLIDVSCSKTVD